MSTGRCVFLIDHHRSTHFSLLQGYCEQALQLSAKYRRHDKYIKIQIENLKQFPKALNYIEQLNFDDAIEAFRTYGKTLMEEVPEETTKLLKRLNPTPQQISEQNLPESLINLFINHPDQLLDYLDYAAKVSSIVLRSFIRIDFAFSNTPMRPIYRRPSTTQFSNCVYKNINEPKRKKNETVSVRKFSDYFRIVQ